MTARKNPIWMVVRRTTYKKLREKVAKLEALLAAQEQQQLHLGKTAKAFASLTNQRQKPVLKGEGST